MIGLLISFFVLLSAELIYFRIAAHFAIIDKPNARSSHTQPIIRGGGIIFIFSILIWFYDMNWQWPWFVLSVVIIGVISFVDDIYSLPALVRFLFQLMAILLLFYQLRPIDWSFYVLATAVVVCIGTINAFNFMDGINGITGIYSLVMIGTFAFVNEQIIEFTDSRLLVLVAIALFIFLFYNFRTRASCFAGDVGSVSMAVILIFLLLQLIASTHNFLWALLFLVYGVDSVITIIHRIMKRENIFRAHRTHLYQYLANELRISHLAVSVGYGFVQAIVNGMLIYFFAQGNNLLPIVVSVIFASFYLLMRFRILTYLQR